MNKLGTVVKFTFMNKVRAKAFLVTTLILVILMTIGINLPYIIQLFTGDEGKDHKIGLAYNSSNIEIAESLIQSQDQFVNIDYELIKYEGSDENALKADLDNGLIDSYLSFDNGGDSTVFPTVIYTATDSDIKPGLYAVLQGVLDNTKTRFIVKDALTTEQIEALNVPVTIESKQLKPDASEAAKDESNGLDFITVYVLIFLFFVSNIASGNMIASEVTSEKSSRIMEILITSASPVVQMFGKILGIFMVGLLQIGTYAVIIGINVMLPHNRKAFADFDIDLSQISVDVLLYGLLFYILGFFLYATLFAAVGSMVSRTEELGQAVMPITMLSMAAFYVSTFSMSTPDSMLMKVSTYIPFLSPVTIIARIGLGHIELWEIAISLVILCLSILFFGWLSAKIYRTGVLMYGKRPSWKELRKAMKAYKI